MYGPGSPPRALKHKQVSSIITGPRICSKSNIMPQGRYYQTHFPTRCWSHAPKITRTTQQQSKPSLQCQPSPHSPLHPQQGLSGGREVLPHNKMSRAAQPWPWSSGSAQHELQQVENPAAHSRQGRTEGHVASARRCGDERPRGRQQCCLRAAPALGGRTPQQ